MRPQSAKNEILVARDGRQYKRIRDEHGTSRRLYARCCIECGLTEWLFKNKSKYCKDCRVRTVSSYTRQKISDTLKQKYTDPSYKKRILDTFKPPKGDAHWNWKGGVTPINQRERNSQEYTVWRNTVYARDNYTCQGCKVRGNKLHAHHIIPWAVSKDLRFDVSNGCTLCDTCHKIIHNYMEVLNDSSLMQK